MADIRGGVWALRSLRVARRSLAHDPLAPLDLPPVPEDPAGERGVAFALGRARATCLERVSIQQEWLLAHGIERDVIIGVTGPRDFTAHAWLDGDGDSRDHQEIMRRRPRPGRPVSGT